VVYFFVGSAFLGDEPLEQKFGRFPDIGEGRVLRTALGRAEVLLTPGVFLRLDESSSIRLLSSRSLLILSLLLLLICQCTPALTIEER